MSLKDWITTAGMYAAGTAMIAGGLVCIGVVARLVVKVFCIGYGC